MSSRLLRTFALAVAAVFFAVVAGAGYGRSAADIYTVHPLVSDSSATSAAATDASLVNGWGLSAGPTTPWWAANNGSNTSTLYSGTGVKAALTVTVAGAPTGTVFNGNAADFVVSDSGKSGAARFLFSTEGGTILGWTPAVNGTVAVVGADRSSVGAVYKGLAIASDRLYATDFHNGRIDVFDASFKLVTTTGGFKDSKIPKGFAPFGIQAIGGNIFVTYAKQDAAKKDDVAVPGQAYVDEFTPDGQLDRECREQRQEERAAERPLGSRARTGGLRRLRRGSARRQLRQRPHQRLHAARHQVGLQGPAARRQRQRRSRSTASGRSRSATAPPPDRRTPCTSSSGPAGEKHGLYGSITAG